MLIDTHAHLYLPEFDDGGVSAVNRAAAAGVCHMILPNVDVAGIGSMRRLASCVPDRVSMAMGLHPTEVNEQSGDALETVMTEIDMHGRDYCAIGEIGIDLYWDKRYRDRQMQVFEAQCRLAVQLDKPVIIHCRDGMAETLEVLGGLDSRPRGVFHSFGGTDADVEAIRAVGDFYFGINGIVTFKNSRLAATLPAIGLDRLLLETDAPYLAPVPHRGKRNESAYLPHVAACVAKALDVGAEVVADVTTRSAIGLFGLNIR